MPIRHGGLGATLSESVDVLAAIAGVDASAALGLAMHTHVLVSAVESNGWPRAAFERLVAAVRAEGALVNAASTEESTGSPARLYTQAVG